MGPFGVGTFQFSGMIGGKVYSGTIDKSVSIARLSSPHLLRGIEGPGEKERERNGGGPAPRTRCT